MKLINTHCTTNTRALSYILIKTWNLILLLREESWKIIYLTDYSAKIRLSVQMFDFEFDQFIQNKSQVTLRSFRRFAFSGTEKDTRMNYLHD